MSFPADLSPWVEVDDCSVALEWYIGYGEGAAPSKRETGLRLRQEALLKRIDDLEARVASMEGEGGEQAMRVRGALAEGGVTSSRFKWTPADYYDRPLSERAVILGAAVPQLCKTMLVRNETYDRSFAGSDRAYDEFYLVVLQYEAKYSSEKMAGGLRQLRDADARPSRSKYHFTMASEEDMLRLAGVSHNAVTPFGCLAKVTVVLSKAITEVAPSFIWMGGGHPLLKLGCSRGDFIKALDPLIIGASEPRA